MFIITFCSNLVHWYFNEAEITFQAQENWRENASSNLFVSFSDRKPYVGSSRRSANFYCVAIKRFRGFSCAQFSLLIFNHNEAHRIIKQALKAFWFSEFSD